MRVLENDALRISVKDNGVFCVLDKMTETLWGGDPLKDSPGELCLVSKADKSQIVFDLGKAVTVRFDEKSANEIEIEFTSLVAGNGKAYPDLTIRTGVRLEPEEPTFTVSVLDIKYDQEACAFGSLRYPERQGHLKTFEDEGYLALPYNQGSIIPSERFRKPPRNDHHVYDDLSWQKSGLAWGTEGAYADIMVGGWNALSMPWFGAKKGDSSFIGIIETPNDSRLNCILNYSMEHVFNSEGKKSPWPRIAVASPVWIDQNGAFGYNRTVRYTIIPNGDYVQMAKAFRQYLEGTGFIKTLREKMKDVPAVERLFGAPLINIDGGYPWYTDYESFMFTWKDIKAIGDDLHNCLGIDRALICTWGGYSKLPPESLPFHPKMGTEEELKEAVQTLQDAGYLYASYHGYAANLFHADSWSAKEAVKVDGVISDRWGGRAARYFKKYAEANLPETIEKTGQLADYTDMISASPFKQYFDEEVGLVTREMDRQDRVDLFQYVKSLGVVAGSETTNWWVTPYLDYCKGGMYHGIRFFLLKYIHVPLFNLVFHDVMVTFDGTVGISREKEYSAEVLESLAYGVNPIFSFSLPYYQGARGIIAQTYRMTSDFLKSVALDELESHSYLDEGYNVQKTRFSSGAEAYINTDTFRYETEDGTVIPAMGFVLKMADGQVKSGCIHREIKLD